MMFSKPPNIKYMGAILESRTSVHWQNSSSLFLCFRWSDFDVTSQVDKYQVRLYTEYINIKPGCAYPCLVMICSIWAELWPFVIFTHISHRINDIIQWRRDTSRDVIEIVLDLFRQCGRGVGQMFVCVTGVNESEYMAFFCHVMF